MMRKYSLPKLSLIWTLCLFLFPVILVQAWRTRRVALKLPEAKGPTQGCIQKEDTSEEEVESFSIVGIGDSVMAGVGCKTHAEALLAQTASQISNQLHSQVKWQTRGKNGVRLEDLVASTALLERDNSVDWVIVSVGVNDVTGLSSLLKWQLHLAELVALLREKFQCEISFLGVPHMNLFTVLPQPLRFALGVRAAMLDSVLRKYCDSVGWLTHIPTSLEADEGFNNEGLNSDFRLLAADGYHPSPAACESLAKKIAAEQFSKPALLSAQPRMEPSDLS